jgi:ectoine hydroxylase-related dioxygenase (phytanoyl-CoA dioxygenase family)
MIESFTAEQVAGFERDGFLIVEQGLVSDRGLELLQERYLKLFEGEYETGIRPDEVNWVPGRDPEDRTRQLCNAWKSDNVVAAQVLSERTGRLAAQLAGYRGVRILQDNVLWKPPGTKAIGFHQDSSYADYLVPSEMITCWISLHETQADAGPLEFVRGSHAWPKSPPTRAQFHAPDDWLAGAREAAPDGAEPETVPVVVKPGGGSFHHGLTWHGSAPNTSGAVARMALVSHFVPVETRFHETNVDVTYSRYRRRGDLSLDESFFPVVWGRLRLPHPLARRAAGPRLAGQEAPEPLERLEDQPRRHRLRRLPHERRDEARQRAVRLGLVDRLHEAVVDRALGLGAVDPVLPRERVERVLASQREHELLSGDAEPTCDPVDRRERDPLDRLSETARLGMLARRAWVGNGRRLERAAAERDVRHDDDRDQPDRDEYGDDAPHEALRRTRASGTSARSASPAARKNGPEKALVTARSS